MKRNMDAEAMRGALKRADTSLLLYAILLFQATAMLLLTLRTSPVNTQSIALAAAMPAVTLLCVKALPWVWRIDRVVLLLTLFLCSVSVVTLTIVLAVMISIPRLRSNSSTIIPRDSVAIPFPHSS